MFSKNTGFCLNRSLAHFTKRKYCAILNYEDGELVHVWNAGGESGNGLGNKSSHDLSEFCLTGTFLLLHYYGSFGQRSILRSSFESITAEDGA